MICVGYTPHKEKTWGGGRPWPLEVSSEEGLVVFFFLKHLSLAPPSNLPGVTGRNRRLRQCVFAALVTSRWTSEWKWKKERAMLCSLLRPARRTPPSEQVVLCVVLQSLSFQFLLFHSSVLEPDFHLSLKSRHHKTREVLRGSWCKEKKKEHERAGTRQTAICNDSTSPAFFCANNIFHKNVSVP